MKPGNLFFKVPIPAYVTRDEGSCFWRSESRGAFFMHFFGREGEKYGSEIVYFGMCYHGSPG